MTALVVIGGGAILALAMLVMLMAGYRARIEDFLRTTVGTEDHLIAPLRRLII
jgi:hypothetical protein